MYSGHRYLPITAGGLSHSEISGSTPACGSPKLIAANHVLHRLLAPRHPPCALSSLTIKTFGGVVARGLAPFAPQAPPLFRPAKLAFTPHGAWDGTVVACELIARIRRIRALGLREPRVLTPRHFTFRRLVGLQGRGQGSEQEPKSLLQLYPSAR